MLTVPSFILALIAANICCCPADIWLQSTGANSIVPIAAALIFGFSGLVFDFLKLVGVFVSPPLAFLKFLIVQIASEFYFRMLSTRPLWSSLGLSEIQLATNENLTSCIFAVLELSEAQLATN